jgi:hypothetical protein
MEHFQVARDKAKKNLKVADHMTFMTYPLVKDSRILLSIMENLFLALTNSMGAILYYDRLFKRVPPFHDTFESKYSLFKERCIGRYNLSKDYLALMEEVKDIILQHKKSPVEFTRKDAFVICSDNYRMKTITIEKIKEYISRTKSFVSAMESITSKNEGIFR